MSRDMERVGYVIAAAVMLLSCGLMIAFIVWFGRSAGARGTATVAERSALALARAGARGADRPAVVAAITPALLTSVEGASSTRRRDRSPARP